MYFTTLKLWNKIRVIDKLLYKMDNALCYLWTVTNCSDSFQKHRDNTESSMCELHNHLTNCCYKNTRKYHILTMLIEQPFQGNTRKYLLAIKLPHLFFLWKRLKVILTVSVSCYFSYFSGRFSSKVELFLFHFLLTLVSRLSCSRVSSELCFFLPQMVTSSLTASPVKCLTFISSPSGIW